MWDVFSVVIANASPIAGVCFLCLLIGWLWFRPCGIIGLPGGGEFLPRLAIYPILGWLLIIVGSSWLRILAIPFRKSAPFLLAVLLLVPVVFWLIRFYKGPRKWPDWRSYLKCRIGPTGGLLLVVGLFALVPINRLTVPSLYDVGVWGFDQSHYVHIADQYIEGGMLEPQDTPSGGVLAPWLAFNGNIFKMLVSSTPSRNSTYEYSSNPDVQTLSRRLGLIMRNGGAALDASFATWFHLDGVQAYVLGNYIQYLLLALAGLWIGLVAKVCPLGRFLLGAIASLWPIAVFPSLLDNRDQALALVIVLVLMGAIIYRQLNFWAKGLILGALALTYIEILPIALFFWFLAHLDERPLRLAFKNITKEIGIALACSFIYIPWGAHYLLIQIASSDTLKLQLPMGAFLGYLSNFGGTFTGIRFDGSQFILVFAVVSGISLIGLQILGLVSWLKNRRFCAAAGFLFLAAIAVCLQQAGYTYPSYKFFTVLFPVIVLLCASSFSVLNQPRDGADSLAIGMRGRQWVGILMALCIPGALLGGALRSGFSFSDLKVVQGMNSLLEDRTTVTMNAGLKVRESDLTAARGIVAATKKKQGVLFSNFSWADDAYFAHFFGRQRPISLLYGFNAQTNPITKDIFVSNMKFLKEGERIHLLLLLNNEAVGRMRYDTFDNIIILKGKPAEIQVGRTFTCLHLGFEEFAFVQRLYSQFSPKAVLLEPTGSELVFGNQGIAFGVYCVNSPAKQRTVQFDIQGAAPIVPTDSLGQIDNWKCAVNGKVVENVTKTPLPNGMRLSIPLDAEPAGHVIEIGRAALLPMKPEIMAGKQIKPIGKAKDVYKMSNFVLESPR